MLTLKYALEFKHSSTFEYIEYYYGKLNYWVIFNTKYSWKNQAIAFWLELKMCNTAFPM